MADDLYLWCHSIETRPDPERPSTEGECYRCGCAIWVEDRGREMATEVECRSPFITVRTTCMACSGIIAATEPGGGFAAEPEGLREFLGLDEGEAT